MRGRSWLFCDVQLEVLPTWYFQRNCLWYLPCHCSLETKERSGFVSSRLFRPLFSCLLFHIVSPHIKLCCIEKSLTCRSNLALSDWKSITNSLVYKHAFRFSNALIPVRCLSFLKWRTEVYARASIYPSHLPTCVHFVSNREGSCRNTIAALHLRDSYTPDPRLLLLLHRSTCVVSIHTTRFTSKNISRLEG